MQDIYGIFPAILVTKNKDCHTPFTPSSHFENPVLMIPSGPSRYLGNISFSVATVKHHNNSGKIRLIVKYHACRIYRERAFHDGGE